LTVMVLYADRQKERALIRRIKDGERAAFDELVDLYRKRGLSIAFGMAGNLEDAKDILQESFIKVYAGIKNFREEAAFSTWFYRVVTNCSLDFLRKRKKLYRISFQPLVNEEGEEIQVADPRPDTAGILLNDELRRQLEDCISSLPKMQRACFALKHQSGLSNQEIAATLGCSMSTVKVHLFRAVKALQGRVALYLPE